jgi:hypothetical protein
MKTWLTFILLLIVVAGTFSPCCLVDACNEQELTSSQKENKQQPEGNCSPFFACATCPASVELSKPMELIIPVEQKPVHHHQLVKFNFTTYTASFFQPPRNC